MRLSSHYMFPQTGSRCGRYWVIRAFTLIELLVVIAIIGVLASMLLPTLAKVKEKGKRAMCMGNHKQIYLATHMYTDDYSDYLPYTGWSSGTTGRPNWIYTRWNRKPGMLTIWDDRVEEGQIWPYHKNRSVYWCPGHLTNNAAFRNSEYQCGSYIMNGSVSAFGTTPERVPFQSYKKFRFKPTAIIYWEADETNPADWDNATSAPSEGITVRHNNGSMVMNFGGHTEYMKRLDFLREGGSDRIAGFPGNRPGRLWCNPGSPNGT